MKRYELYLDNDDRLVLSEFKTIDSEYESGIYKGKETYELIRNLAKHKLVDLSEIRRSNILILEYKHCVIHINDQDEVLEKRGVMPLIKNIKDYYEKESLNRIKNKKVKRKNKHVSKKMVAVGLVAAILAAGAGILKSEAIKSSAKTPKEKYKTEMTIDNEDNANTNVEHIIIEEPKQENISIEEDVLKVSLNYEDRSDANKPFIVKSYYSGLMTKYARMYGIDPNLVMAVATQESKNGIHSPITDPGGATGVMQIQNDVWIGNDAIAYNFETGKREKVHVTLEKIQDVELNIKIGCMILQNNLEYMNYNPIAGLQCYNMGYGNMKKILNAYSKEVNKSIEEILNNFTDTGWMNYRNTSDEGDPEYVEEVLSWMGEDVNIKHVKKDGTLTSINVDNKLNKKVY